MSEVDLMEAIRKEADKNCGDTYKEYDLASDADILMDAADAAEEKDKWFLYMTRENGTWMLKEELVWLRGTPQNYIWTFYLGDLEEGEHPKGYLVHVTGKNNGKAYGQIKPIKYSSHASMVKKKPFSSEKVLTYEYGETSADPDAYVEKYADGYGHLVSEKIRVKEEASGAYSSFLKLERAMVKA